MAALDAVLQQISDAYKSGALKTDPANLSLSAVSNYIAPKTQEQEIDDAFAASKKNAGNLKDVTAEYPGQPTVYASAKYPTKAYVTGADGEKYVYVPLEFVQKGMIDESTNEQYYTPEYLNGNTFKNAIQYTLPDSAGLSPMFAQQYKEPNKGFLWKQSDFDKVVSPGVSFYSLNTFPPILGTGVPSVGPNAGDATNHYYITQPNKVSPEYALQFYVGTSGDVIRGYNQVYYTYPNDPTGGFLGRAVQQVSKELGPIVPMVMNYFAPGSGDAYIATQAVIGGVQTGQWGNAALTLGMLYGAPMVADKVTSAIDPTIATSIANKIPLTTMQLATQAIASATTAGAMAAVAGKDPVAAFRNAGIAGAVPILAGSISGFNDLNPFAKMAFNAAVTANLTGKDPTQAVLINAFGAGLNALKAADQTKQFFDEAMGRPPTIDELNKFIWFTNPNALANTLVNYKSVADKAADLGYTPTDEKLQSILKSSNPTAQLVSVANEDAKVDGWSNWTDKRDAAKINITDPGEYRDALARNEGWGSDAEKATAKLAGFETPGEYTTATALGLDIKAEYQDYQNKAAIFKNITGRDATADDIKKYVSNIPTQAEAKEVMRELTTGKRPDEIDKKYDYNGDGVVNMTDAIEMLKAAVGTSTIKPNPNTIWGQTGATDEQFKQKITDKTEEEKVIAMLHDRGISPNAERVAAIMKEWNFNPATPNVGFSEAFDKSDNLVISSARADSREEAAALAASLGYSKFTYPPGGDSFKINPAASKENPYDFFADKNEAFRAARADKGPGQVFPWTDPTTGKTQEYTTSTAQEQAVADQKRIDMMPAYGGARNTQTGKPTGAVDLYIDKKTGSVVNDTRVWNEMGEVVGGELSTVTPNASGSTAEKVAQTVNEGLGKAVQAYLDVSSGVIKGGANLLNQVGVLGGMTGLVGMDNWATQKASDVNKSIDSIRSTDFKNNEQALYAAIEKAGDAGFVAQAIEAAKQFGASPLQTAEFIAKNGVTLLVGGGAMTAARALGAGMGVAEAAAIAANAVSQGADVAGDAYKDALKNGKTEKEALDAARVAWAGASLTSAVANKFIPGALSNESSVAAQTIAKNSLATALKGEMASELAEETSGKIISNIVSGNPWDKDLGSTAVQALIGSGAVTGLVQVASTGNASTAIAMAKDAGVTQKQIDSIQSAFNTSVGTQNFNVQQAKDQLSTVLTNSKLGSDAISQVNDLLATNAIDSAIKPSLQSAGVPTAHLDEISNQVAKQILAANDQQAAFAGVSTVLQNNGLDPLTSNLITNKTLTGTDVKTSIANTLKAQGYTPTQAEVDLLVSQNAKANPTLISKAITEYTGPRLVTADEAKAALVSSGLTNPSQAQIDALTGQYDQSLLASKANTTVGDISTQLSSLDAASLARDKALSTTLNNISAQVTANQAAGMNSDQALSNAIDKVATSLGTTKEGLLTQMGKTEQALKTDIAGVKTGLETQITGLDTKLSTAIAEAKASGLSGDQALQTAIDKVATSLGTTSADILTQMGKSTADLKTQFATDLAAVSTSFETKLAASDAATKTAFEQMSADQKAEAKARVDQGETLQKSIADVKSGLGTQITDLATATQNQYKALSAADKAQADALVAQGKTLGDAIATVQSGVTGLTQTVADQYASLTAAQKAQADALVAQGKTTADAIATVQEQIKTGQEQTTQAIANLDQATQTKFDTLTEAQKQQALQLADTTKDLKGSIDAVSSIVTTNQAETQARLNELKAAQEAQKVANDERERLRLIEEAKRVEDAAKKEEERKAAEKDAADKAASKSLLEKMVATQAAGRQAQLTRGLSSLESAWPSGTSAGAPLAALVPSVLTSKEMRPQFEGALSQFQKLTAEPYAGENQYQGLAPIIQQEQAMNESPYYSYGQSQSLDDIFGQGDQQSGGDQFFIDPLQSMTGSYAAGGLAGTRYGKYAGGGMATPLMAAGGKLRVDFRGGDAVTGAGDGQSDDIPAMLADGEFVFPADVVAAIGNGSTKAGSDKLYDMMHGIRAHVRSAHPKELPPEIKSPLDFLKTKPRKARS